jgi:hypothetical protein
MTNMHLTRLHVEQLRQFRQAYVLNDLTPGSRHSSRVL